MIRGPERRPPADPVSAARPTAREPWRPLAYVLLCGLLAAAFLQNDRVTRDLVWPAFDTQYREMAAAQTFLDQGPGPDPAYRNESLWYNPLSAWIAAGASMVSGQPLREIVPRLGPVVNLLAPAALFALLASLVDLWSALAATAAFLFVTGNALPFSHAASYSPWFAPENYGQGLLYLSLLLAAHAHRSRTAGWHATLGLALGVTFLAHTAPALILGATLVVLASLRIRAGEPALRSVALLVLTLAVALLTSLPLIVHVLGRYHLAVVNHFPSTSPDSLLDLDERLDLVRTLATRSPLLVALVALPWWLWSRRRSPEGQVLLAWTVAVLLFFAYGDVYRLARKVGFTPPTVVPTFHFLFHAMALVSVGFGIGLVLLARYVAERLARRGRRAPSRELLATVMTALVVIAAWEPHARRRDVTEGLKVASIFPGALDPGIFEWIRTRTAPDDVFLATDEMSLFIVSPAGRKVVCTNRYFSNPYVDWKRRDEDRNRLFELVNAGDLTAFDRLAARYGVRYVVASDWVSPARRPLPGTPRFPPSLTREELDRREGFERVFTGQDQSVYRRLSRS